MALQTVRGSANIPEGMIKLSKEDALDYQKRLVAEWPSVTDVIFLRYGRYIGGASAFLCSALTMNYFCPLLKFRKTFTSVIPSTVLPTVLVYNKTDKMVTNEVLTLKMDCPLCYHLKYTVLNVYAGLFFPVFLAVLNMKNTHNIEMDLNKGAEYWKKSFEIVKKGHRTFKFVLFVQLVTSFVLPYKQQHEINKIIKQLNLNNETMA